MEEEIGLEVSGRIEESWLILMVMSLASDCIKGSPDSFCAIFKQIRKKCLT